MIDNIKIWLRDFSGDFLNCVPRKNRNKEGLDIYNNYNLRSLKPNNPSILRISLNKRTNQILISGSIRKWYLHEDTLKDLDRHSLERAFKALSKCLNITIEELYSANFTQSEIGQNVKISLPVDQLNKLLVKYGNKMENKHYGDFDSTNYYTASKRELLVYDKLDDIVKNNKEKSRAMSTLKKHGHYFARIEFTLFSRSSRNLKQIKHIEKLGDLVSFNQDIWQFWYNEVNKIVIDSKINTKANRITKKQKSIGILLNRMGYIWVESQLLNRAKSTTEKGLKSKKTRIKQSLSGLIKKYADQRSYTKEMFMNEIEAHVLKQKDVLISLLNNNK